MAGRIRRSDIDEVRSRISIVDVVGEHVTLKTAGVGSMKGLCPFHDERTPSFHVRPAVGRYHCFGCGEDGDVFQFVMAMDHTSFAETVERFAAQLGYTLHYEDGKPQEETSGRLRLLAASREAEAFFQQQLLTPAAALGQRFLGERGFDLAAAQRFGVGYAPASFDALKSHLRGKGFSEAELLGAGLLSEGQRGSYDRFRGRLVWPIRDVAGATMRGGPRAGVHEAVEHDGATDPRHRARATRLRAAAIPLVTPGTGRKGRPKRKKLPHPPEYAGNPHRSSAATPARSPAHQTAGRLP